MIKLLENLYLDNDNLQFILKKKSVVKDEKSKNFGKETFTNIGYYPKLEQLLQEAVMKKLKDGDYSTLAQLEYRQMQLIHNLNVNIDKLKELLNSQE